jgi:hypothetical protein
VYIFYGGSVSLASSTISSNRVGVGGSVAVRGSNVGHSSILTMINNSTISGNSVGLANGGGVNLLGEGRSLFP